MFNDPAMLDDLDFLYKSDNARKILFYYQVFREDNDDDDDGDDPVLLPAGGEQGGGGGEAGHQEDAHPEEHHHDAEEGRGEEACKENPLHHRWQQGEAKKYDLLYFFLLKYLRCH